MTPTTKGLFASLYQEYLDRGWEVLPLPEGQKGPPPPGTTGRDGKVYLSDYGDGDLGIRMPRGVVGLDWDARGDAIALQEELEAKHGKLPDTWSSSSKPWPSRIDYYRLPEGHEDAELPGSIGCLDIIQRHHRYAKVAGTHPDTGDEYVWTDPDGRSVRDHAKSLRHLIWQDIPHVEDLPILPIGWLDLKAPTVEVDWTALGADVPEQWRPAVQEPFARALSGLEGGQGSRHDIVNGSLMALANAYVSGYGEASEAVLGLRERWMEAMSGERGERAALEEWDRMLSGAEAKALPISQPPPDWAETWPVTEEPAQPLQPPQPSHDAGYWSSVALDLNALDELPDLEWAIRDCIPEGSFSTLYGPTGIGKTFVMLDMTLTLAAGSNWHGHESKQQNVLYLVGEGVHGYKKRVKAWRIEHPEADPSGNITFSNAYGASLRDAETLGSLIRYIEQHTFTFIVIDTVNMFAGGIDENSSKDMTEFTTAMTVLANETGATVVAVHHTGKDVRNGARGSSVYASTVNSSILVTRDAELPELTLRFDKLRDAEAGQPLKLEMYSVPEADSAALRLSNLQADRKSGHMQEILALIRSNGGTMSQAEIIAASPVRRDPTIDLLREATRQHLVSFTEGGGRGNPNRYSLLSGTPESVPHRGT